MGQISFPLLMILNPEESEVFMFHLNIFVSARNFYLCIDYFYSWYHT